MTKFTQTVIKIALGAFLTVMQSCFTGIESTPKITDKDLRRQNVVESPETRFARELRPEGLMKWRPGRRFLVTDPKLSMLFELEPEIKAADTLVFEGFEYGRSITGDSIAILCFKNGADLQGRELRYPLDRKLELMPEGFAIPFAVDLDLVESVNSKLSGKEYFLLTPLRSDFDGRPIGNGRKFIPVRVEGVYPGNELYPLRVEFVDDRGEHASVVMTVGEDRRATRNFDALFSFSNPRLKYPQFSDAVWNCIVESRAVEGMTTDECLVALGAPRDVRKGHNGSSYFEAWTYDNGVYLMFEDGLLTKNRY